MNMGKMNSWLTLTANIGVLAGILFLAIELRQNSDIARADSYREIVQDIANWRSEINNNPELLDLWMSYAVDGEFQEMPSNDK